jgi:hypothetical protein
MQASVEEREVQLKTFTLEYCSILFCFLQKKNPATFVQNITENVSDTYSGGNWFESEQ